MKLLSTFEIDKNKLIEFFKMHWGSTEMVISSGIYDCSSLNGFAILNGDAEIIGLITYVIRDAECEIISLDSLVEGQGIGSALIQATENIAKENQCKYIKVITTNDNLHALKFYQKRDYWLSNIYRNAVEEARKIKPEIPLLGNDGIPIRDEIELKKSLK